MVDPVIVTKSESGTAVGFYNQAIFTSATGTKTFGAEPIETGYFLSVIIFTTFSCKVPTEASRAFEVTAVSDLGSGWTYKFIDDVVGTLAVALAEVASISASEVAASVYNNRVVVVVLVRAVVLFGQTNGLVGESKPQ